MKTLRCSKIGVALSLFLLPIALPASDWTGVAEPAEFTDVMKASADEAVFFFEASLTDGTKLSYPFAEQPTLRNQGNDLVLTTTKEEVLLPQGSVKQFTIVKGDDTTGIEENRLQGEMRRADDVFYFAGCRAGSQVRVYDRSGAQVKSVTIAPDGTGEVSLQHLPSGVYVIKSEVVNFKYLKK